MITPHIPHILSISYQQPTPPSVTTSFFNITILRTMANGGAQIALSLSPPLTLGHIVPFRALCTIYKEGLDFSPTFKGEASRFD